MPEIRGGYRWGVAYTHTLCVCVCVGHAGAAATCIADDDAIWCPNAAPTAKYAPVVVFTPSSKRACPGLAWLPVSSRPPSRF